MKTLTWKVDKTIPTACPDYQPDPYTGEYPMTHCLVYHCKTITEEKTAEFSTEKEVREFVEKVPLSCYEFKLNGELLEDKREKLEIGYCTGLIGSDTTTLSGTNLLIKENKK